MIFLLAAVYLIYEFHRQLTFTAKEQFVGLASSNLIATDQTIKELKYALNLAGENYQQYAKNNETQEFNYDLLIEDGQKNLEQINNFQNNLEFQSKLITNIDAPDEYEILKSDFDNYYEKLNEVLTTIENNIILELDILKILNSTDSTQDITLTSLWQDGSDEELIDFYKKLQSDSVIATTRLQNLGTNQNNNYYQLNKDYLALISSSASEIVSVLNGDQSGSEINTTEDKKEEAYRVAIRTQSELDKLIEKIIDEGASLYALNSSSTELELLYASQESLEMKVKNIYQQLYLESSKL